MNRLGSFALLALVAFLLAFASGCTPSIGSPCILSQDCSVRGDRQCDTSQVNGYCTVFNCAGNTCPNGSSCVAFETSVPGCGFDDRLIARTARSFCLAQCSHDSDCRTTDGYVCRDVTQAPWDALILDDLQTVKVCVIPPTNLSTGEDPDAGVCSASVPDAAITVFDASAPATYDGGMSTLDGGVDASFDAPADAPVDAPGDATLPPTDASSDSSADADASG